MAMSSFPYKLNRCESSTCTDHTEYICGKCQRAFCSKCKVRHLNNLETMDHKIVNIGKNMNTTQNKRNV